jgi:aminotransferase in exopolysaccharide biosynthesis
VSVHPAPALADRVLAALRAAIGPGPAALHEPQFTGNERQYLLECIDSTFVSSVGRFVDRFEADLAAYTGARHAVAVVNGTAALHVALLLAGVQPGDEVLVPALTFVATANAVTYCGALPHFVDCESRTLGMDADRLRAHLRAVAVERDGQLVNRATGRVIRALVPMHVFGHPSDLDALLGLADDFRLALVEDAAEALGSFHHGRHVGTRGLLGTLSFNGNKTVTTGGGGAILTDDAMLARRAKHLTTTAKLPHAWEYRHDEIGFNYRMPNLNAALGCAQLEQLPQKLAAKRQLSARYQAAFADLRCLQLMAEPEGCRSNFWLQTLVLDAAHAPERDAILRATNDAGLMTRPVWHPLHGLTPFADCPRMDLSCTDDMAQRLVNIPSNPPRAEARHV